ncbi:MAG: DUF6089 family protein [Bacteroidota bacterium]
MKKLAWIWCLLLLWLPDALGQRVPRYRDYEIGLMFGTSYYNGELNPTSQFNTDFMNTAFGVVLRKNLSTRWALRSGFYYGAVNGDDAKVDSDFNRNRNLSFHSSLWEASVVIEFNFLHYNPMIRGKYFTPYSFIGLGLFRFNPKADLENNTYELHPLMTEGVSYKRTQPSIPFGIGFKFSATDRFLFSVEWGLRRTFTDYIDDVSGRYPAAGELDGLAADLSDRSLEQIGEDGTNWGTQRDPAVEVSV